jgi:ketosteroid isomerase-like protein
MAIIERKWAERFAKEWAANWHERDLDALLSHYAENVVFHSPRIAVVLGEGRTSVSGISELRDYWRKAIDAAGELRFEVAKVAVGSDAITILYRNHRGDDVAETLVFGDDRRIVEGIVTYF